ncbi:MAG: hypothetical protein AMXMBFR25_09800 [Lysobacterales bacterium]|nr:hypothetical protein [Xanthomonadales bacterium]
MNIKPTIALPRADGECLKQRDDIQRLVGVIRRYGVPAPLDTPRILVPIDGSEVGDALVERVIEWRRYGWSFDPHLLLVRDFLAKEAAERLLDEISCADTESARERLREVGIGHTLHVVMGTPAPRILERAAAVDAAMILMGTRGHGPIGSAMLGSVAYKVVHESTRPVTLLRA